MSESQSRYTDEFKDPLQNYDPKGYSDALEEVLAEGNVKDIICSPHVEIQADSSVFQALQVLNELRVASLLVMDHDRLVGVFTERDVLECVVHDFDALKNESVRNVMTADPIVVYDTDSPAAALAAIAVASYRHVPVLDANDRVVGIISPQRLFSFIEKHIQAE